uniref:Uncharacterized protein n=1 Tax=Anopheles maculatus TaxID=74869 RepID=A0A182SZB5_9DIPT
MSMVLVLMGMMMYCATLTIELFGYATRVCQQMQIFTTSFGLLLTTLGIIANQFAQELVLAARILSILMLMSECCLALMYLLPKYSQRQCLSPRHHYQEPLITYQQPPVQFIPDYRNMMYGRVLSPDNPLPISTGNSYPTCFVPQAAPHTRDCANTANRPHATFKPSVRQPPPSERASINTVESVLEPFESVTITGPPTVGEATEQPGSSNTLDDLLAAAKRRVARNAFRLNKSVQQAGEEQNESAASTGDQPSAEPFSRLNKNQQAIRPTTLNLPKTTFRWPSVDKSELVPSV